MSFLIHSISNSNVVPMEYYPCGSLAVVGTPMYLALGLLQEWGIGLNVTQTEHRPIYISMGVSTSELGEGSQPNLDDLARIPVIRVRDDIIFEATSAQGALAAGDKVYIKATSNGNGKETSYDYSVEKVSGSEIPQFEVVEAKEPDAGSTVQKVLIRYIG